MQEQDPALEPEQLEVLIVETTSGFSADRSPYNIGSAVFLLLQELLDLEGTDGPTFTRLSNQLRRAVERTKLKQANTTSVN